jgi:hypothetical protein
MEQLVIVECVLFNDELELLEARFHEGENHVDRWIIIEAVETFSGQPKALHYLENVERFTRWADRIQRVEARLAGAGAWNRERQQRDALVPQLLQLPKDATVALCDGDELIAAKDWPLIEEMTLEGTVCFPMVQHYFTLCWSTPDALPPDGGLMRRSRAARAGSIPPSVSEWADGQYGLELRTGWHLSCLGGPERLQSKLQSFSHTELANVTLEQCEKMIREGIDIEPTRNWPLTKVEPQGPEWLLTEGVERWPWLLTGGVE